MSQQLPILFCVLFVHITSGCNVQVGPPQNTGWPTTTTPRPTAPTHTTITSAQATTTTKMKLSNNTACGHKVGKTFLLFFVENVITGGEQNSWWKLHCRG